ncbi:MAG: PfkB family carbohydrate kinase [Geminicoccaceae bacterium]
MTRVLCVGIAVVDFIFRFDTIPHTSGKHIAKGFEPVVGGMATNGAIAVTRLGGAAALMSRVGADPNGRFTRDELMAHGVDVTAVEETMDAPTSLSAVAVGDDGERMLFNYQHPSLLLDVPSPPRTAFGGFDALLVDTRWPAAGVAGLELAAERGVPGVVDIDHGIDAPWLETSLCAASHVVFSSEGLAGSLGTDGLEAGMAEAGKLTSGRIAVTMGGDGVVWLDGQTLRRVPAFPVRAVDTLGAGDVFHGALALALGEGRAWPDALVFASAAAAVKCSRPSGRSSFPTHEDVATLMSTQA